MEDKVVVLAIHHPEECQRNSLSDMDLHALQNLSILAPVYHGIRAINCPTCRKRAAMEAPELVRKMLENVK